MLPFRNHSSHGQQPLRNFQLQRELINCWPQDPAKPGILQAQEAHEMNKVYGTTHRSKLQNEDKVQFVSKIGGKIGSVKNIKLNISILRR